jgi:hypothetical protein
MVRQPLVRGGPNHGAGPWLRHCAVTVRLQVEIDRSETRRHSHAFASAMDVRAMDAQAKTWKAAAERLWSADVFDCRAAAQLASDIARQRADAVLREAASQALPSLRAACAKGADRRTKEIAQRRFAAIRDVLHALTVPRFGKRKSPDRIMTLDERHRRMLGLPLDRRLFGPEIHQAYKQAAKKVHPDAGGSQRAFLELSQARDALMKRL